MELPKGSERWHCHMKHHAAEGLELELGEVALNLNLVEVVLNLNWF